MIRTHALKVTTITYPDGNRANYSYVNGRVAGVTMTVGSVTSNVASAIAYRPDDAMAAWTSSNGLSNTLAYDSDGRLTGISVPGVQSLAFAYDGADRISQITNGVNAALTQSFGYGNSDLSPLSKPRPSEGSYPMHPKQMSPSMQRDARSERHRKSTRRDVFLAEMDQVVPWDKLCAVIAPHYPKEPAPGAGGRRAVGLERMLRIHFLQQWYALSDPAVEEALYDSAAMRRFVGIDLGQEGAPDETTVCKFRHLLEQHGLADQLFAVVNKHLRRHGMKLSQGTIVDATIIAAAPSTKNQAKARDPEMHQTRKGQQWYFGMKAHIGVDEGTGLVHTVVSTAANVADVAEAASLLHGKEKRVFGDAGYIGAEKRAPKRGRQFWIAAKRSVVKAIKDRKLRKIIEELEHAKASIRSAVEHPFRVLKRQFGYVKARYKGLAKNGAQVTTLFALVNLWMARKQLLQPT